ncbi:MAG: hypothetical protein DRP11_03845, partial [Candidatus Aenigmatarchaeota archaeon]
MRERMIAVSLGIGLMLAMMAGIASSLEAGSTNLENSAQRTMQNAGELIWKYQAGGEIFSSPAIGNDGTIYFGSTDTYVYALNPDGSLKWKFQTEDWVKGSPSIGEDGSVYVCSNDKHLYAINPNGTLEWKQDLGVSSTITPAIGQDGTIYTELLDLVYWKKYLLALNPDGSEKWRCETGSIVTSPVIDQNGTIYVGCEDDKIYAVNPEGTSKWTYELDSDPSSDMAIDGDGVIYIGDSYNILYAINPDGSLKWKFEAGGDKFSAPTVGADGTVYVCNGDKHLYAINLDGTEKWKYNIDNGDAASSPTIGKNGTIYVGSSDYYRYPSANDHLYAIHPDGTLKWKYQIEQKQRGIYSPPVIVENGTIYFGATDYYLYALHTESQGLADSPWPIFGHDVRHTGRAEAGSPPVGDTTPPAITSGPSVSDITETSAVITWTTDELSSSVVQYGTTTAYGLSATGAEGTDHSVELTGLSASTTYHYRVGSADASGNETWSEDDTFTTLTAPSEEPTGEVVIREIVDYDTQVPDIQPTKYNESIRAAALSGDGSKVVANILIKGERALYYGKKQDESALYLCNSDGTGLTRILDSGEDLPDERIGNRAPITRVAITDDGSKIAFGWLTDYMRSEVEPSVVVSTINADGTELKEVARIQTFCPGVPSIGALAISGDGSKIAFSTILCKEKDDYEIFLMNADGTDLVQLTDNDVADAESWNSLDISDDGTRVVWEQYDGKIYVYDSVTGRMDLLAEGEYPSISGDGQTVVFGSEPQVAIIGFDGTGLQTLGSGFYYIYQTFISDNGKALAFRQEHDIIFMRADGTDKIQLDSGAEMYGISDDGTKVLHRRHAPALYIATIPSPEVPAGYNAVAFSTFHNSRLQDICAEYPEGDVILGSIPFSIPTGGNNMWSSRYSDPNPHQIDISVGVSGVSKVYTLINSDWGQDVSKGSFAAIEFYGSDGAFFRKDLYGNVDIRDWQSGNWTNSINGTTTTNVFQSSGGRCRLDMQTIDLPDDFQSQTLETVRVIDTGGQTFQRIFLAGITVEAGAEVPIAEPTELVYDDGEPTGGYYYEVEGTGSAVRMSSPFTPATVVGVCYYIANAEGSFIVRLFDDQDGMPGADLMTPLKVTPTDTGWLDVDLSSYNITVDGDFYVAFMCGAVGTPSFGFNPEDNGRAWDYDG